MSKMVPVEKMSKRAQKALTRKRREMWTMSPITRKVENKKHDFRKKALRDRYDDYGAERSFYFRAC